MHSLARTRAHQVFRSLLCTGRRPATRVPPRALSTKPPEEPPDAGASSSADTQEEDDFIFDEADETTGRAAAQSLLEEEAADLRARLQSMQESDVDVSPELASEVIAQVIESAGSAIADRGVVKHDVLPSITPHTIAVLRASRMVTNDLFYAVSELDTAPIENKVSVKIDIADLRLNTVSEEALKYLAGPRVKGEAVQFSVDRFPSRVENQYYALSLADRLVSAAKTAGGEALQQEPLDTWAEIAREVERQVGAENGPLLNLLDGRQRAEQPTTGPH